MGGWTYTFFLDKLVKQTCLANTHVPCTWPEHEAQVKADGGKRHSVVQESILPAKPNLMTNVTQW